MNNVEVDLVKEVRENFLEAIAILQDLESRSYPDEDDWEEPSHQQEWHME